MRDALLLAILVVPMLLALRHPWIGVLAWTWLSIMNPHALSWNLRSMPFAAAMVGATMLGLVFSRDKKQFFATRETVVLILFILWMCITLPFSFDVDASLPLWSRVMKIDFMILVAMLVLHSRKHIEALVWVLAGSIGFYGVKGGLFTLATGGVYRVWGPANSYIEGNNEVALALVITIPLMEFLRLNSSSLWVKRGLIAVMILCAIAALGSQSRGALLAIAAMTLVMWSRSKNKLSMGMVLTVLAVGLLAFMPDSWVNRMDTIQTYEQDTSALGRINAWWMAFNLAKDHFFGGGFAIYNGAVFATYAPDPTDVHAAHSIYFMVLGEHGFVGLFLFVLLWVLVWLSAGRLRAQGRLQAQTQWLSDLGSMSQVSLAGYAVGGAFLSLSYYDLPYNVLLLVVLGRRWLDQKAWIAEAEEQTARPHTNTKLAQR